MHCKFIPWCCLWSALPCMALCPEKLNHLLPKCVHKNVFTDTHMPDNTLYAPCTMLSIHSLLAFSWKFKKIFWFPISYANSDCNFLKWIAHKPCKQLYFPKDHMSNILRPRVRSSTGCLLRVHSSCCVQDGVLDPGDIRRAGRWCVDGGRSRSRVRRYTLVLLQVSHPGHRKTGPLIGGS